MKMSGDSDHCEKLSRIGFPYLSLNSGVEKDGDGELFQFDQSIMRASTRKIGKSREKYKVVGKGEKKWKGSEKEGMPSSRVKVREMIKFFKIAMTITNGEPTQAEKEERELQEDYENIQVQKCSYEI